MANTGKTTTMLKAKFSNKVNSIINPNPTKGKSAYQVRREVEKLTTDQKLAMLDKIITEHLNASVELQSYLYGRRNKKRVQKLRDAKSGNKPAKNRTTKAQWEAMQNKAA